MFKKIKTGWKKTQETLIILSIKDIKAFKNKEKFSCKSIIHPMIKELDENIQYQIIDKLDEIADLIRDNVDADKWFKEN